MDYFPLYLSYSSRFNSVYLSTRRWSELFKWSCHIEFLNFEFTFVISDFKNPRVSSFIKIEPLLAFLAAILEQLFAPGKETSGAVRRQNVALYPTIVYIELNGKLTFFLFYLLFPLSKIGTQRQR